MHKNHHQVNSNDLSKHKNELNKPVLYQIKSLVQSAIACQAIISLIEKEFGEVVLSSTIKAEQNMELDNLYDKVSKIPHGKSADLLIALFQAMSNTSYIYVKHDVDSGFVTYNKPTSSKHVTASTVELAKTLKEEWLKDVQKVRQSLKLDGSNKILVAIAWSHDEEVRKAKLFPEYITADTTFGVNRQRRNLFVCCIPDGRNKVFTIMKCFMSSKQMAAYVWPIAYALPYLVGVETTRRVSCISTNAEKALVDAINIATNRNHFSNVKHRLDFYHHFTQVWEDNCTPRAHHREKIKDVLNELCHWIKSWYTKLESKDEYDFSKTKFDSYLQVHSKILGRDLLKGVEKCVQNFEKDINCVSNWNFLFCTTLGFVGSTIVEIANSGIKGGHNGVKATMTPEKSAHLQSKQIEEKKQKHFTQMAQGMNLNKLWTKSQTADYLEDYIEGLCVKAFDNRTNTCVVYDGNQTWLAVRRGLITEHESNSNSCFNMATTEFDCVRKITIDEKGSMICSCGNVHRYLAPCKHIIAVLDDEKYVIADLFHIRWWKVYNYYYHYDFAAKEIPDLHDKLDEVFRITQSSCYNSDGAYRGCNVSNTGFMDTQFEKEENDKEYKIIKALQTCIEEKGSHERCSCSYKECFCRQSDLEPVDFHLPEPVDFQLPEDDVGYTTEDLTKVPDMGQLSQADGEQSAFNQEMRNHYVAQSNSANPMEKGGDLWNLFQDGLDSCQTTEQRQKLRSDLEDTIRNSIDENSAENRKEDVLPGDTVFQFEDTGKKWQRDEKRRKRRFEK